MALEFPSNPGVGDFYDPPGSPYIYQWDGEAWILTSGNPDPATGLPDAPAVVGERYGRMDGAWVRVAGTAQEGGVGTLINNILSLTQVEYDALTKSPTTLYLIV